MSSAFEVFDHLVNSRDVKQLLNCYERLNEILFLNECVNNFSYFSKLKKCLQKSKQILKFNKISSIIGKLEKRSQLKCYYQNSRLSGQRVLVIGGGISGLRVAIELLLLGADVICVEKRDTFSRNNVIHLWPNVIQDLRLLAAKRFYGRFCVGSIDHVAIRQIQLILLKIALIYGLKFCPNITFDKLCPKLLIKNEEKCDQNICHCCCHSHGFGGGAYCHFIDSVTLEDVKELNRNSFDIIVGADGRRNTLFQDFPRKEFRGKLAIAITANFVNRRTEEEVRAAEISGVSYIYAQKWFKELFSEIGVQLENICYYRDETHYFVMTATKQSLLSRGVLLKDISETHLLLDDKNIDRKQLLSYARDAAQWTSGLRNLEFAQNASNSPDVALFDFTSVYASRNASRAKRVRLKCCSEEENEWKYVLMLLTGDSLLEPFWPTGSGAGRGFLSALDAAFTSLQWTEKVLKCSKSEDIFENILDVISERESIYRLLAQTTPENVNNCKEFSLFPNQRYQNWRQNSKFEIREQIRHLIGGEIDNSLSAKRARRATVAVTSNDIKRRPEEVKEKEKLILNSKEEKMKQMKQQWLLGDACGGGQQRQQRVKKENIIERAQQLEQQLKRGSELFEAKLSRVGRIEENDWNFKVWNKNLNFREKPLIKSSPLPNSKAILESRKQQLEEKFVEKNLKIELKPKKDSKKWIQIMSEELTQRMKSKEEKQVKKEEEVLMSTSMPSVTSSMPQCVRCGLDVSAVERISVSGDVLHRSCLRCSKCGISLRLNEFRNELKFLCIYCLKSSKNVTSDRIKAKEDFLLKQNQKIDFRERIEFENRAELEIIEKRALNEDSDSEITFDLSSTTTPTLSSSSSDSEWQTEEEEEEEEEVVKEKEEIPSIHVTTEDNGIRYSGSFTEKLFRSKSQPMLITRQLKVFGGLKAEEDSDSDLCLPFADIGSEVGQHFSPIRGLKAPIIEFKDI